MVDARAYFKETLQLHKEENFLTGVKKVFSGTNSYDLNFVVLTNFFSTVTKKVPSISAFSPVAKSISITPHNTKNLKVQLRT